MPLDPGYTLRFVRRLFAPLGYKLVTHSTSYNNLLNEGYDYAAGQTITYYNSGHIYRAGDKVSFGSSDTH